MIRRLVADVAKDLPEKVVSTQPLEMSDYEAQKYTEYVEQLQQEYDADTINIGAIQQLRVFCTHPFASTEIDLYQDPAQFSVKYQRLCEIVGEIIAAKEKVIVFCSFKKMFTIFGDDIPQRFNIPIWSINGDTPIDNRQKIVDVFNEFDGPAMLVLNPKAAGAGLNITGANHVIHYNLEWNPALEDQASARAYRRGQQKTVFVYRLYYIDTVEQVVNERIERKRDISDVAIVGNDGVSQDRADIIRAMQLIPNSK
jgi:SNF2 family DNA or RNA helicase